MSAFREALGRHLLAIEERDLAGAVPIAVTTTILASMLFLPLPANLPEPRPPEGGQVSRVYDQNGEEIGSVENLLINDQGQIVALVAMDAPVDISARSLPMGCGTGTSRSSSTARRASPPSP